ncbi:glycosyl hydrolases family 35-domain-containing protein [Obelidium mucronatum]|nr:glycosyl hydrolases family 35-domain-containing protein [Obelidium mucronatum]
MLSSTAAAKHAKAPLPVVNFAFDTSDDDSDAPPPQHTPRALRPSERSPLLAAAAAAAAPKPARRNSHAAALAVAAAVALLLLVLGSARLPHDPALPPPPLPGPGPVPPAPQIPKNVTYNRRAVHINGAPELLLTATIHYPRSDPSLWPSLLQRIKLAGNNAIDTYVFWNLHEPEEGAYDFENGIANLPLFLQTAHEAGLYVVLRIGPYVCAEWNFGGFPVWLLKKPGIEFRTWNDPFIKEMSRFVEKTLVVVEKFLAPNGGPIILLQIENEYGNIANTMGPKGYKYIQWAGEYSKSLDVGVPWIMCRQDNVPVVLNAENGFYADSWIEGHHKRFPDQPAMVTELWTGWFQKFGQPKYTRYGEDLAYAAAKFIAKGGTYIGYYMWHGGTNFGKWGSDWKTASYDYDAVLNEYGFPNNPKHNHIADLHLTVTTYKNLILSNEPTAVNLNTKHAEAYVYGQLSQTALIFFVNDDSSSDVAITFEGKKITLPHWSVTIYLKDSNGLRSLYCTARVKPSISDRLQSKSLNEVHSYDGMESLYNAITSLEPPKFQTPERNNYLHQLQHLNKLAASRSNPSSTDLTLSPLPSRISHIFEPIGVYNNSTAVPSQTPLEHIRTTVDKSDYMWYVRPNILVKEASASSKKLVVHLECLEDVGYVFVDGVKIHDGAVVDVEAGLSANEEKRPAKPVDLEIPMDELLKKKKKKHDGKQKPHPSPSPPPKKGDPGKEVSHDLAVLVGVAGLWNYGAVYENVRKGILGAVKFDKVDVTKGSWVHQVGLKGEHLQYSLGSKVHHPWQPSFTVTSETRGVGLVWYLIKYSKADLLALHDRALQTQLVAQKYNANSNLGTQMHPITSFVLNLSTMSRGMAFVNGHQVGRYWNLKAICNNVPCRYPDTATAGGESCAVGCGYASQSFYNVPTSWILEGGDDGNDDVEVVLFDESGGDPLGVSLSAISG